MGVGRDVSGRSKVEVAVEFAIQIVGRSRIGSSCGSFLLLERRKRRNRRTDAARKFRQGKRSRRSCFHDRVAAARNIARGSSCTCEETMEHAGVDAGWRMCRQMLTSRKRREWVTLRCGDGGSGESCLCAEYSVRHTTVVPSWPISLKFGELVTGCPGLWSRSAQTEGAPWPQQVRWTLELTRVADLIVLAMMCPPPLLRDRGLWRINLCAVRIAFRGCND